MSQNHITSFQSKAKIGLERFLNFDLISVGIFVGFYCYVTFKGINYSDKLIRSHAINFPSPPDRKSCPRSMLEFASSYFIIEVITKLVFGRHKTLYLSFLRKNCTRLHGSREPGLHFQENNFNINAQIVFSITKEELLQS